MSSAPKLPTSVDRLLGACLGISFSGLVPGLPDSLFHAGISLLAVVMAAALMEPLLAAIRRPRQSSRLRVVRS
jgi:hypothetical protein